MNLYKDHEKKHTFLISYNSITQFIKKDEGGETYPFFSIRISSDCFLQLSLKNPVLWNHTAEISKWALAEFPQWESSTMPNESGKEKRKGKTFLVYDANELGKKKRNLCRKVVSVWRYTAKKNGRSILHISLSLFYILNGVFPTNGKWCIGRCENTFCFHIKSEEEACRDWEKWKFWNWL